MILLDDGLPDQQDITRNVLEGDMEVAFRDFQKLLGEVYRTTFS